MPEPTAVNPPGPGASAEELRQSGHDLVDRMADYLASIEGRRVFPGDEPSAIARRLSEPLPRSGRPASDVWDEAWSRVVEDSIHLAHPMYMGHQVAPPLPHAVLADALASLMNNSVAVWEMSPTGTIVEQQVIRWMIDLVGYPATADGTLVSGGSAANLTGLLAAREAVFPGSWRSGVASGDAGRAVVLAGAHAHYSVERAVGVMGLGSDAVVPVGERAGRIDVAALGEAVRAARAAGRIPMAIVATAGSTATGQFDDLEGIADVARSTGVWLHVDGAHGASALVSPRLRERLRGLDRADSLSWDPHKMMFMPISAGSVLVRDRRHLDAALQQSAPYLFHPRPGEERSWDIGQRTLQCSKRFDALKLWISLRHYGLDHFAALQERAVANAELLHRKLSEAPDFDPLHHPESNILCFRYLPGWLRGREPGEVDGLQQELRERYNRSGRGWITATRLEGRRVLRVTLMNPRTEERHLDALLEGLRDVGRELEGS